MILRAISVQGVKCFRDQISVGRFGDGLNMIFAPNETGKSTLIEAAARALFDDYKSKGDSIKRLRPWGTSLAPTVTLEFSDGGKDYRLTKRLLDDPLSRLERQESGVWSALHERDAADDFVRDLLHGERAHGASDLRHWGLARTLWCLRDPSMIGKADGASCVVPSSVASQFQSVLGEGVVGAASDAVIESLRSRYDDYFTPATGKARANSRLVQLRDEVADLAGKQTEARNSLDQVEAEAGRLEGISGELEDLSTERAKLQEQIDGYRKEAGQLVDLRQAIKDIEGQIERARSDSKNLSDDLGGLVKASETARASEAELSEVIGKLDDLDANLRTARQLAQEADVEHGEAQTKRKRAATELEQGRKLEQVLSLVSERRALADALANIDELTTQRAELTQRLQEMPSPSDDEITEADRRERLIERLQVQLEGAGLSAQVVALAEQEVRLRGGEADLDQRIGEGEEIIYVAGSSLEIELPEVVRVTVRSGASEPAELKEELDQVQEELSALLAPFAADSSNALRDLQRDHERATEDLERHDEGIEVAARPYDGPEAIVDRQGLVRSELARLRNELGLSEAEMAGIEAPAVSSLTEASRVAQAHEDEVLAKSDNRRKRVDELGSEREGLINRRGELETAFAESTATVTGMLERHGCENEVELQALAAEADAAVETLDGTLTAEREKLPSEEMDPLRLVATGQRALDEIGQRELELTAKRGDAQGVIERARTEGRYEQLTQIEERLGTARRELYEAWREAQAIKLLSQLVDARRSEITSGALPGLEDKLTRMLRHITGRRRSLRMDDKMAVTQLIDGETEHDPDDLSSGAREQLDLVTRVALGETYAERYGRTVMVLDDALLYTDPRRHDRIKQVLQRAGDALQILILTSHPDRYRGIVPAECQFDLESISAP